MKSLLRTQSLLRNVRTPMNVSTTGLTRCLLPPHCSSFLDWFILTSWFYFDEAVSNLMSMKLVLMSNLMSTHHSPLVGILLSAFCLLLPVSAFCVNSLLALTSLLVREEEVEG